MHVEFSFFSFKKPILIRRKNPQETIFQIVAIFIAICRPWVTEIEVILKILADGAAKICRQRNEIEGQIQSVAIDNDRRDAS